MQVLFYLLKIIISSILRFFVLYHHFVMQCM